MSELATIPSVPRAVHLPFGEMPWDRFEAFCADLIASLPGITQHSCHRYGSVGHKQRGIDIYADRNDGSRWAFSNKRYKKYDAAHVVKHVTETTYSANRYFILISTVAGTDARDTVRLHPNWDLWDADDLCREVRQLADQDSRAAQRIVDTHFGSCWRRQFLNLRAVAAFLTPTDYFKPLLEKRRLFHHGLDLVGRTRRLQELLDFAADDQKRISILPGRGGIGKSRLLKAFADELDTRPESSHVWFQVESVPLDQIALDELPSSPCIVIVDDAHRIEQLGLLLAYARRRSNLKVLLASRPRGLDGIWREINRSGFDSREVVEWQELADLKLANVRELARAALGTDREVWVERLVSATGDCPLVTVIGAKLLTDSAVAPELLVQHDEFRRTVLSKLCDDAIGQVASSGSADLTRQLLWVLAALAPLDTDDVETIRAVSKHLIADETDIRRLLDHLESVGVVVSRGGFFRITPDVLADHLLSEACFGTKARPTGFATKVFAEFTKSAAKVLRNLAELDWRVRETRDEGTTLLNEIWVWIDQWFRDGDLRQQANVLDLITDVADYQPERVLGLVRTALKILSSGQLPSDGNRRRLLNCLPTILQRCAVWFKHLPECLEHLWTLCADPDASGSSQDDDPFKIIRGIGEYHLYKQFRYSQEVADAALRWSQSSPTQPRQLAILEIIRPLFSREIEHQETHDDGHLRISWHQLSFNFVRPIRDRGIQTVRTIVDSGDVTIQLKAIELIDAALSEQGHGPFSVIVAEEWEADQLQVLNEYNRLVATTSQPIIHLHVMESLRFKARHGRPPGVSASARQVIAAIPRTFEFNVTRLLIPASTTFYDWCDEEDANTSRLTERNGECMREFKHGVVTEFWNRYPTASEALNEIERRVIVLRQNDNRTCPRQFVWDLLDFNPAQATLMAELMLSEPTRPSAASFDICLSFVRMSDSALAEQLVFRALDIGNESLANLVAHSFWSQPRSLPSVREIEIIRRLLLHPSKNARAACIAAISRVGEHDASLAISLIHQIQNMETANDLCFLITSGGDENRIAATITNEDLRLLLARFQSLTEIDNGIKDFLKFTVSRLPDEVLEFLLDRIRHKSMPGVDHTFRALPFRGVRGIFAQLPEQIRSRFIRKVRDSALPNDSRCLDMSRLFRAVSANYSQAGLVVLREWLDSSNSELVTAAVTLLADVPHDFVFAQAEFVQDVIERAGALGNKCGDRALQVFSGATTLGGKFGWAGERFPRDIKNRDLATERLQSLESGTRLYQLYDQIRREAERAIAESDMKNGHDGEE